MKRTWLLLILFLALGGASAWYLWRQDNSQMSRLRQERDFAVPDTDDIHKIFLAHRDGEMVTLTRQGNDWLYNGKWKARPGAMDNLLDAIRRLRIKYVPPRAAVPAMVRDLGTQGIKVELYARSGRLIKSYYIGGSTPDERGTYIIREGFNEPFVGELPGWEGNLRFRYNLRGEDWRDRAVFAENPDQIVKVSLEYPKQRNQSFVLEKKGNSFDIRPFYDITPESRRPYRPGSAEAFLVAFENLGAEAFRNDSPERDSVLNTVPFCIISLTNQSGQEQQVKLFPIYPDPTGLDPKSGYSLSSLPVERYYAAMSSGDFMLVQHRVFKNILWGYPFFFEQ